MKRIVIIAIFISVGGCGPSDDGSAGHGVDDGHRQGEVATPTAPEDQKVAGDAGDEGTAEQPVVLTDPRQELLEEEWGRYHDRLLRQNGLGLPDGEKTMLGHLLRAAQLVEEIHMLQLNRENLAWKKQVEESGTDIEKKIFSRFQSPWCADNESSDCCALASKPDKEIGRVHWPADITGAEFEAIGQQINGKELLSPFTVVRRSGSGKLDAVPYSRAEIFGQRMKELAVELRAAAQTAPDGTLEKFLKTRADALEADSPFPYDQSDLDWIGLRGDWEVIIGPYETYGNPRRIKALFEMCIGRENKKVTTELARLEDNRREMEDAVAAMVGAEIYKGQKPDPRISIRAVDVWMASGDARRARGAAVIFDLPNRGKAVDEGLHKKVIMVNHALAFESMTRSGAEKILGRDQFRYVDPGADLMNLASREFSHVFGADGRMKVTNPRGKEVTVEQAIGENHELIELAKAEALALWLVDFEKKKGRLDGEQSKKRYISAVMRLVGLLQYPLEGVQTRMAAIQLGWYLEKGAFSWDSKEGRLAVDIEKLPEAVESLAVKVATIQLTGDRDQAGELLETYLEQRGDGKSSLKGDLEDVRKVLIARLEEGKVRGPSLRYEVTGF